LLKSWTPGLRLTPAARRTREALAQAQAVPPVPRCVVFLPGRAAASVTRSLGDSESRSESLRLPVAVTVPGQPDSVSLRGRLRLTGSRYPGLAGPARAAGCRLSLSRSRCATVLRSARAGRARLAQSVARCGRRQGPAESARLSGGGPNPPPSHPPSHP
jgi:hypothetical protein